MGTEVRHKGNIFITTISKMNSLLTPELKRRGVWMLFVVFLISVLEIVGLASLIPLINVIVSEKEHSGLLRSLYSFFGTNSKNQFILILCTCVLVFFILKTTFFLLLYRIQSKYVFSIYRYFTTKLLKAYYRKGFHFIKKNNSLVMIHNINSTCLFFSQSLVNSLLGIVNESVIIILMLTAALVYKPSIVMLLILTILPVCYSFYMIVKSKMNSHGITFQNLMNSQNKISSEIIKGFVDLEVKNKFSYYFQQHRANSEKISNVQVSLQILMQMPGKFIEFGIVLSLIAIILLGQFYFNDLSRFSVMLAVFGIFAFRLLPGLNRIVTNFMSLKQFQYVFSIFEDVDLKYLKDDVQVTDGRMKFKKEIEIHSVSFRYDKSQDSPVLNDFNCKIKRGEIVGIIGKSGSGKSTLLSVLLNFIQPDSGSIKVDGAEVTADNVHEWRNIIGYVPQEVFIAETTLAANIAFAEDYIDEVALKRAIELSNLGEFVSSLPDGQNTILAEGGNNLSGGQRQRIGIARALYKNAEILFFDEATSALDQQTENEISESIRQLSIMNRSLTIVIIAHRLSTLRNCSRILEIKDGGIYKELKYHELA